MTEKEKKQKLDPVAEVLLQVLKQKGAGGSVTPPEAAQAFAESKWAPDTPPPGEWRSYLNTVKQQALYLARSNRLVIVRKGKPADTEQPIKGVVRYALPVRK